MRFAQCAVRPPADTAGRVQLLLDRLFKYTPQGHADFVPLRDAIEKVDAVATHINEQLRVSENRRLMMEIQEKFDGVTFIAPHRVFVLAGTLQRRAGRLPERPFKFFLFNDKLLWSKQRTKGGKYHIANSVPVDERLFVERVNPRLFPNTLCVIYDQESFLVTANSEREADAWFEALSLCIDENARTIAGQSARRRRPLFIVAPVLKSKTESRSCFVCEKPFSLFRGRYNCKGCGEVVCDDCSKTRVPVPCLGKRVRICMVCTQKLDLAQAQASKAGDAGTRSPTFSSSRRDSAPPAANHAGRTTDDILARRSEASEAESASEEVDRVFGSSPASPLVFGRGLQQLRGADAFPVALPRGSATARDRDDAAAPQPLAHDGNGRTSAPTAPAAAALSSSAGDRPPSPPSVSGAGSSRIMTITPADAAAASAVLAHSRMDSRSQSSSRRNEDSESSEFDPDGYTLPSGAALKAFLASAEFAEIADDIRQLLEAEPVTPTDRVDAKERAKFDELADTARTQRGVPPAPREPRAASKRLSAIVPRRIADEVEEERKQALERKRRKSPRSEISAKDSSAPAAPSATASKAKTAAAPARTPPSSSGGNSGGAALRQSLSRQGSSSSVGSRSSTTSAPPRATGNPSAAQSKRPSLTVQTAKAQQQPLAKPAQGAAQARSDRSAPGRTDARPSASGAAKGRGGAGEPAGIAAAESGSKEPPINNADEDADEEDRWAARVPDDEEDEDDDEPLSQSHSGDVDLRLGHASKRA
jgi:hypothetical protein